MKTFFYIVRHGQSEGNLNGDITGTNPPLTEKGIDQAKALAQLLKPITINQIFASSLIRAKHTAQIIASPKNLKVSEKPLINERFFGSLEGVKDAEVRQKYQGKLAIFRELTLAKQLDWKIVDDMESLNEVLARVLNFLSETARKYPSQTILLVTHANVMLALLAHFKFINSFNDMPYGSIQNTAYIKLETVSNTFKIAQTLGITKKALVV